MEREDQIVQQKNDKIISLEKSILVKSISQEYKRCCCIYYNTFSREIKARLPDPESSVHCFDHSLQIIIGYPCCIELIKKLKFLKFFDIRNVALDTGKSKIKHILNFIDFSFPNKTNDFTIYLSVGMKIKSSTCFNSLVRISSKIAQRVTLKFFSLSLRQLKRLVAAYRHVEGLNIWSCKLSIPKVPDFSRALQNCKIQVIDLWGTGNYSYSNWGDNPSELKNLIQGLASSSDLKLSLREVHIGDCGIKKSQAEQIFTENQLEGVEIVT
ncbi:unnamed protein product [Moneuplotes crassus]|uniref:Uncharacterized protein n=1 Tax=Euplotes crassus TaxID=5936 RepID=A0AAD1X865_EUPCR|nr:unnamed protein product [Moneuplotes crassus]